VPVQFLISDKMDELKNIVATFVKKDPAEIEADTLINKRVISGSILLHRMYAAINNAGYPIKDYNDINTYGELLSRLNGSSNLSNHIAPAKSQNYTSNIQTTSKAVGIDIESISNFPIATDFREDNFYKLNFSMTEISYCILKQNPQESFAGLFSAKEALCKANEQIRKTPFNLIEIKHDENGKPTYPGFSISISHNDQFSVAIAIANEELKSPAKETEQANRLSEKQEAQITSLKRMVVFSVLVAIAAAVISIILLWRGA
jgi:phosphopantetheine--protein transferase-like protein